MIFEGYQQFSPEQYEQIDKATQYTRPVFFDKYDYGVLPIRKPKTNLLYHYTNFKAAESIISKKELWAFPARNMNDTKEVVYLFDILREVFSKPRNAIQDSIAKQTYKWIHDYDYFSLFTQVINEIYFLSFSEEPDKLSQWRGYCNNGGLSIGFDFNKMYPQVHNKQYRLFPCIYEKERQVAMTYDLIAKIDEEYRKNEDIFAENIGVGFHQLQNLICDNLIIMATIFKHPGFIEEQEWRIVIYKPLQKEKRTLATENKIVPYIPFSLNYDKHFGMRELFIGPNRDQELVKFGMENFAMSTWGNNYDSEIKIKTSECSYRQG